MRHELGSAACAVAVVALAAAGAAHAQEGPRPWVEQIAPPQYFAVLVEDVGRSVAWYRTAFGLRDAGGSEAEDGSWRIANLRSGQLFVEIIRDDRAVAADRALGFRKVGFFVPDVRAVAARLGEVAGEAPRVLDFERFGVRIIQIHDPDGNTIQLFSPLTAREPAAADGSSDRRAREEAQDDESERWSDGAMVPFPAHGGVRPGDGMPGVRWRAGGRRPARFRCR